MKRLSITILLTIAGILFLTPGYAQFLNMKPGAPHNRRAKEAKTESPDWHSISTLRDAHGFFCMYFKDDQNGWVGGASIIIHTTDGGKTWENQWEGGGRVQCMYFKNANDGFAAGESNFYIETHDGGKTWKNGQRFNSSKFEKIFFTDDKTGFMLTTNTVWRSTDGGKTWKDCGIKKPMAARSDDLNGLVAVDAKHLIVVGGNEMMFTSDDGGATWVANNKSYFTGPRKEYCSIAFTDAKNGWISIGHADGDPASEIDALYTTDGGATWAPKACFDGSPLLNMQFNGKHGWATRLSKPNSVYVTHDGGQTWNWSLVAVNTGKAQIGVANTGATIGRSCGYYFSDNASYAGVNGGDDGLFSFYVPN